MRKNKIDWILFKDTNFKDQLRYKSLLANMMASKGLFSLIDKNYNRAVFNTDTLCCYPFWIADFLAKKYIKNEWKNYIINGILLNYLFEKLFPYMLKNDIKALLFYPPAKGKAIIIDVDQFQDDIVKMIDETDKNKNFVIY